MQIEVRVQPIIQAYILYFNSLCLLFKVTADSNSAASLYSLSNDDHNVEDNIPTLQETLETLSLSEYFDTFEKEKIDMESLVRQTNH